MELTARESRYIVISQADVSGEKSCIWTLNNGHRVMQYDAVELPTLLSDIMKYTNRNLFIYITRLSMYAIDAIKALWAIGYTPIQGNPPLKKMKDKEYKYLISEELTVYSIVIKQAKRSVTLCDIDNIITVKNCQKVIEAYNAAPTGDIYTDYSVALYTAIATLDGLVGAVKKPPVTISGYARRAWLKTDDYKEHRKMLIDASSTKLPTKQTVETYCRAAYHGGLNLMRPEATPGQLIDRPGCVLDANSLYPYIMATKPLPYGRPQYGEGKPTPQLIRDANGGYVFLYIRIKASFELKPGGVPCVQLPIRDKRRFLYKRGWLENSRYYDVYEDVYVGDLQEVELTLTQIDLSLFLRMYDIKSIEYIDYLWFTTTTHLFNQYIARFYGMKTSAPAEASRKTAKMLLNSLSGNMARLPEYSNALIKVSGDGRVVIDTITTTGGLSYVYIGAAITSYARAFLISYALPCGSQWLYSDTDSIHIVGEIPAHIPIGSGLGQFKVEKTFTSIEYYRHKIYGMLDGDNMKLTLAGVPRPCVKYIEQCSSGDFDFSKYDILNPYSQRLTTEQAAEIEKLFDTDYAPDEVDDDKIISKAKTLLSYKMDSIKADMQEGGLDALKHIDIPVISRGRTAPWESQLRPRFMSLYDKDFLYI